MGFKRIPVPPFDVVFDVVGPGHFKAGAITATCKPMKVSELAEALKVPNREFANVMASLIVSWDADDKLTEANIASLLDEYPGTAGTFMREYSALIYRSIEKN